MNPKLKAVFLVGSQVAAAVSLRKKIKEARRDNDRLALVDSLITALGVITGTLLVVRELRKGDEK